MASRRAKPGSRQIASILATLGSERAAKKFKVTVATLARWRREGVPTARRHEVQRTAKPKTRGAPAKPKPPTPPAPAVRDVKWRDPSGRWRSRSGKFVKPSHHKKPAPRKHAPPAKPRPSRRPGPPKVPKKILHPEPGSRFPQELLPPSLGGKLGHIIGQTAIGRLIVLPSSLEELAQKISRPVSTLKKWIKDDRVPPDALANLRAVLRGARPHSEDYKHGRRARWTRAEAKELREAAEKFKEAWEKDKAGEAHAAWRAVKDRIRGALTKKAWSKLMKIVGRKIGLADTGRFSVEMWRIS
jgi:hypothetical protein